MLKQPLLFPALVRTAEDHGVVFERLPADQKRVPALGLDATLELVGEVARSRGYDDRGFGEGPLEIPRSVRQDVEHGDFQDQGDSPPRREL